MDPVQVLDVPLQWNPYLYGDNSPVTKADPTGLCWICGIGNAIVQGAKAVAGTVKQAVTKAVATVKKTATAVVKKVATVAAKVVKAAVQTVKAVAKAVTTAAKTVKAVVTTAVKKVTAKVKQVASTVKKTVNNAAKAAGNAIAKAGAAIAASVSDDAQLVLDVIGLVPVIGELADGANAVIYAAKGDYANAALSAASMVPGLGMGTGLGKLGIKAGNAVAGAVQAATKGGDHIVLGLRAFGLEGTASKVGGRTLLKDPHWQSTLRSAVKDPTTRFTVSLDGMAGDSTYSKIMRAAQRGASGKGGYTDWEMAELYQGGRLADTTFVQGGSVVANPFAL